MSNTTHSPEEQMRAHQFLYYVLGTPTLSDFEYDMFCKNNNLFGGGGSDCASDYSLADRQLAASYLKKK